MIGRRLSHYVIVEQVGAGGMGVVYRARDDRLDRDVALKILSPDRIADDAARKRFRREALLLSKLNHPHINQIYDVDSQEGIDFLVMEFIEGETLSQRLRLGRLSDTDVLSIGVQVAEALEEAHGAGIVHRDLKPGNVMLTARGSVKVLDFGVARTLEPEHGSSTSSTMPGVLVGTLPYMAPEQFRGLPADARSDIYSLGAMLYEIATGVRAFAQETPASLIEAVLKDRPKDPSAIVPELSPSLEGVILRSLEKEPEQRYATAREIVNALHGAGATRTTMASPPARRRRGRRWGILATGAAVAALAIAFTVYFRLGSGAHPGGGGRIESLAVLPLEDLSGDSLKSYFADGMTDALITRLAQIGSLRVISRTSAMRYRGSAKALPDIARELHVDAVVEGTVLRAGNQVRITAQLVDPKADRHLWANTYERELVDVIALQGALATAIADQVHARLTPGEREGLGRAARVNPEAYDEYLKGSQEWAKRTQPALEAARRHFVRATEIDPRFALAYAGLADVYLLQDLYSGIQGGETLPRAEEAARAALEIDGHLAEAYSALAMVKLYRRWDWAGAEADFKRAIELRPNYATAHHWYSILLRDRGRVDEAIAEARRALDLDPLSPIMNANLGDVYFFARRYDDAIRQHRIGRSLEPGFAPTHLYLAMAFAQHGEIDSALVACRTARALTGDGAFGLGGLGYVLARAGKRSEAERTLDELGRLSARGQAVSFDLGMIWAGLGDAERSVDWIRKARLEQPSGVKDLGVDPRFDSVRANPRFREVLRQLGLG